jgi:hypothetical protein
LTALAHAQNLTVFAIILHEQIVAAHGGLGERGTGKIVDQADVNIGNIFEGAKKWSEGLLDYDITIRVKTEPHAP